MEKVRSWCGQPSDRGRLKNRTEQIFSSIDHEKMHKNKYFTSVLTNITISHNDLYCILMKLMLTSYAVDCITVINPGPVSVSICVPRTTGGDDCCGEWSSTIEVKFCQAPTNNSDHFYVYKLKNVPQCDMAYCAEKAPIPYISE